MLHLCVCVCMPHIVWTSYRDGPFMSTNILKSGSKYEYKLHQRWIQIIVLTFEPSYAGVCTHIWTELWSSLHHIWIDLIIKSWCEVCTHKWTTPILSRSWLSTTLLKTQLWLLNNSGYIVNLSVVLGAVDFFFPKMTLGDSPKKPRIRV